MKIQFTKKCFVKGKLWDEGTIADVDNADDYKGVAELYGEPAKEIDPKPEVKPTIKKTGLKK